MRPALDTLGCLGTANSTAKSSPPGGWCSLTSQPHNYEQEKTLFSVDHSECLRILCYSHGKLTKVAYSEKVDTMGTHSRSGKYRGRCEF